MDGYGTFFSCFPIYTKAGSVAPSLSSFRMEDTVWDVRLYVKRRNPPSGLRTNTSVSNIDAAVIPWKVSTISRPSTKQRHNEKTTTVCVCTNATQERQDSTQKYNYERVGERRLTE